jgi:hypothetical protein
MYIISAKHRYGVSYWNGENKRYGARWAATEYETEDLAGEATCDIAYAPVHFSDWERFAYGSPQIEEIKNDKTSNCH